MSDVDKVFKIYLIFNYTHVCEYVHHIHAGAHGRQKRASYSLNLGLQPVGVLGTTLLFSTRAVCAVNHQTISIAQTNFLIPHLPKSLQVVFFFSIATADS